MLKLDKPLVCLDVETTGLSPRIDRIVQFAMLKSSPEGTSVEWSCLINPGIPIPSEATDCHGITDEDVATELPFRDVASTIFSFIDDCHVCGYNVDFDLRHLKASFKRVGIPAPEWRCVIDAFRIFQRLEKRDLVSAVRFYLNEEFKDAHDARTDTAQTLRVLNAQVERYDLPRDIRVLEEYINQPQGASLDPTGKIVWRNGEACINFGDKYTGVPLRDVSAGFLQWMLNPERDFSPIVKRIVKDAIVGKFPRKET